MYAYSYKNIFIYTGIAEVIFSIVINRAQYCGLNTHKVKVGRKGFAHKKFELIRRVRERKKKSRGNKWRWLHQPFLSSHLAVPPVSLPETTSLLLIELRSDAAAEPKSWQAYIIYEVDLRSSPVHTFTVHTFFYSVTLEISSSEFALPHSFPRVKPRTHFKCFEYGLYYRSVSKDYTSVLVYKQSLKKESPFSFGSIFLHTRT